MTPRRHAPRPLPPGPGGGIARAARAIRPDIRVVGISMDRGAAMAESLEAGHPVPVEEVASLADSLGGGIGADNRLTLAMCRELLDEVVTVTEEEIYRGMQVLYYEDRIVAEGACVVGIAAVLAEKVTLDTPTATVISHALSCDTPHSATRSRTTGWSSTRTTMKGCRSMSGCDISKSCRVFINKNKGKQTSEIASPFRRVTTNGSERALRSLCGRTKKGKEGVVGAEGGAKMSEGHF